MPDDDPIIDRIYEAAALPETWSGVLDSLEQAGDGDGALLFTSEGDSFRYSASTRGRSIVESYLEQSWHTRTDRIERLFRKNHAGFVTDFDIYTGEEIERQPVYTEFLRKNGLGWGAATGVFVPNGDKLVVSVERAYDRGPMTAGAVRRLDGLRPHLARAIALSSRLKLKTVRAAADALELVGLPCGLLDRTGRIIEANPSFEGLGGAVFRRHSALSLLHPAADELLQQALGQMSRAGLAQVQSIGIAPGHEHGPMVLHLVPVLRSARDLFGAVHVIAVVTELRPGSSPSQTVLEGLFDLTGAESRVAQGILAGSNPAEIAQTHGVSIHTVRHQVKAIFAKVGVTRQADLINLLSKASLV